MATPASTWVSPAEYLARERAAQGEKSEYYDGVIYAISGVSRSHSLIESNLTRRLSERLEGTPCETHGSDMRVRTPNEGTYVYPDLSVACENAKFDEEGVDVLLNPIVIVEVLSPSTESFDRGRKFKRYQQIESLQDYVLVAQDRLSVDVFSRTEAGWLLKSYEHNEDSVAFPSLNIQIPIIEIYQRVKFETAAES